MKRIKTKIFMAVLLLFCFTNISKASEAQQSRIQLIVEVQDLVAQNYYGNKSRQFRIQDNMDQVARSLGIHLSARERNQIFSFILVSGYEDISENGGIKPRAQIVRDLNEAGYNTQALIPTLDILERPTAPNVRAQAILKLSPEIASSLLSIEHYNLVLSGLPQPYLQEILFHTASNADDFAQFLEQLSGQMFQAKPELINDILKRGISYKSDLGVTCEMQSFLAGLLRNSLIGDHEIHDPNKQKNQHELLRNLALFQNYQVAIQPTQDQDCMGAWGIPLIDVIAEVQKHFFEFQKQVAGHPIYLTASQNKSGPCSIQEFQSWQKGLSTAYLPKSDYYGGFTDQSGCSVILRVKRRTAKVYQIQISFWSSKARHFFEYSVPPELVLQKLKGIQFSN